jgi:hypothetical protein
MTQTYSDPSRTADLHVDILPWCVTNAHSRGYHVARNRINRMTGVKMLEYRADADGVRLTFETEAAALAAVLTEREKTLSFNATEIYNVACARMLGTQS